MILKQMTTYRNADGQHIRVTESTMQSLPKTAILHALIDDVSHTFQYNFFNKQYTKTIEVPIVIDINTMQWYYDGELHES